MAEFKMSVPNKIVFTDGNINVLLQSISNFTGMAPADLPPASLTKQLLNADFLERHGFVLVRIDDQSAIADLIKVREWINALPIPRPNGTTHISMVIAQAIEKLGVLD